MPNLFQDLVQAVRREAESLNFYPPSVTEYYFPRAVNGITPKGANFGIIVLGGTYAGILYTDLSEKYHNLEDFISLDSLKKISPIDAMEEFLCNTNDERAHAIGLGLLNAISQGLMAHGPQDPRDSSRDMMQELRLEPDDLVGMVGYFPPIIAELQAHKHQIIVIEKKPELLAMAHSFTMTLDPNELQKCSKVIITATTILNNTLDEILTCCSNARRIAVIGPTGGTIAGPLFTRGVDIVCGTAIDNIGELISRMQSYQRWGAAVRKYCIVSNQSVK